MKSLDGRAGGLCDCDGRAEGRRSLRNIAVCQKEKEEDYQFSGTQKITPVGYQTGVKISLSVHHEFL